MRPLVLFDYDGVLVDSLDYFLDAFLASCREHGCGGVRTRADFLALFDLNFYDGMAKAGIDGAVRDAVFRGMAARLENRKTPYALFPGIPETLRKLALLADLYVISSNDSAVVRRYLDDHDLRVYRDVLGADKEPSKTRKIRTVAAAHPGVPVFYVGDTAGDIREARAAGAIAVGAAWGWHGADKLAREKPDHLLAGPAALLPCIRQAAGIR